MRRFSLCQMQLLIKQGCKSLALISFKVLRTNKVHRDSWISWLQSRLQVSTIQLFSCSITRVSTPCNRGFTETTIRIPFTMSTQRKLLINSQMSIKELWINKQVLRDFNPCPLLKRHLNNWMQLIWEKMSILKFRGQVKIPQRLLLIQDNLVSCPLKIMQNQFFSKRKIKLEWVFSKTKITNSSPSSKIFLRLDL